MSFFGALAGLGQGLADEGAYMEKANAQRDLLAEKNAAELQRQRERAQDRADRERENLLLRAELQDGMGGGKGSGGSVIDRMFLTARTPEEQANVVAYIRARGGEEAGQLAAQRFGQPGATETVNPTAGDFARFDRQADPDTGANAAAVPQSFTQRASFDAEKGRIALNRVFGMASGKFKDYAEGEARSVGTDAVRNAKNDAELRQAGAVNMALESKDRFGVQGDQSVDKALGTVKQTDLGNAKAQDERASAGEHSAKAGKAKAETEGTGNKGGTAQAKLDIQRARERRMDLKDQIATTIKEREQGLISKDDAKARLAELKAQQTKYDKIIDDGEDTPKPAPTTAPKADAPLPLPPTKDKLVIGKTYNTARGPAKWNGTAFEAR